jgi:hypothetical protein
MGVFYGPGVLAESVKNGEVHVSPMSALMEMKVRSADLLYSGKIIKDICAECAPEILKPGLLISKDVDALFTFLRVATYGPVMQLSTQHDCENAKQHSYELNIEHLLSQPNNGVLKHKDTLYKVTLSNEQVVNIKPNTYEDSLRIMHMRMEMDRAENDGHKPSDDDLERVAIDDLLNVIESVQNDATSTPITDRSKLVEWLRCVSKKLLNELMAGISRTDSWGYDYTAKLVCKDCGETFPHPLDLNPISFFYG